jgi:plastocyanin
VKPAIRDRLVLPILLPIGIVLVMALILYGFSRILLSITPTAAWVTAIVVAIGIVVTASVAAGRKQVRLSTIGAMLGVTAGIAMLAGGVALAVVGGEEEGPGGEEKPVVTLAAFNIAFEPTSLDIPAAQPFTLRFNNKDAQTQHNVEIFDNKDFGGQPLFAGDIVTGVRTVNYAVGALPAGDYFFRCIVHANMTGEMQAAAAPPGGGGGEPGGGGGGPGGGGAVTVVAQNISFDTSEIDLPADAPSTITFDNKDAGVPHNIAIFNDSSLSQNLFTGDIVTGPGTAQYQVPALSAGEYYFHCDVHPNMSGSVVVGGGGGGGGGPPTGATGATGAS